MHIVGLQGQPRRTYTYEDGYGFDFWNLVETIGAFIIALARARSSWSTSSSATAATVAGGRADRARRPVGRPLARVDDPEPDAAPQLRRDPDRHPPRRVLAPQVRRGRAAAARCAIASSAEVVPDRRRPTRTCPSPSYWPIVLAFGLPVIAYGLIFNLALAFVGGAIVLTAIYGWVLEPPSMHGDDGHGDDDHGDGDGDDRDGRRAPTRRRRAERRRAEPAPSRGGPRWLTPPPPTSSTTCGRRRPRRRASSRATTAGPTPGSPTRSWPCGCSSAPSACSSAASSPPTCSTRAGCPRAGPGAARPLRHPVHLGVSSFVLLMSSLTMVLAVAAISRGDQRNTRVWLLTTALLGVRLHRRPGLRVHRRSCKEGMGFTTNVAASAFFTLTGFHGVHVTLGIVMLMSLFVLSLRGRLPAERAETVEIVGLYWHFVDVVWIVIFTVVYLIPVERAMAADLHTADHRATRSTPTPASTPTRATGTTSRSPSSSALLTAAETSTYFIDAFEDNSTLLAAVPHARDDREVRHGRLVLHAPEVRQPTCSAGCSSPGIVARRHRLHASFLLRLRRVLSAA